MWSDGGAGGGASSDDDDDDDGGGAGGASNDDDDGDASVLMRFALANVSYMLLLLLWGVIAEEYLLFCGVRLVAWWPGDIDHCWGATSP